MGKRIWQYPEVTGITNDDVILLDNPTGGSRSIKANEIGSVLINKTLTERGTFDAADDNVDGYKKVTVDVPYTDVEVASGPIASWDDGEDLPLKSLTSFIEPQQEGSGDPSPDNIRPISGHTKVDVVVSPLNISQLYNGQIYGDGTWVENSARLTNVQTAQSNVYFLKAGTYTLDYDKLNSNAPSLLKCSLLTKDENYNIIDNFANAWQSLPFTFTLTQDGYLYFTMRKDNSTILNTSDYKAKILGKTYNVQFTDGDNPLTVYGGTLDVVSGELTVYRAYVDMGTLNWTLENGIFRLTTNVGAKITSNTSEVANMICSIYKTVSQSTMSGGVDKCVAGLNWGYGVRVQDTSYSDVASFKTAMNGVQLVYPLATPQTYQLTPTQVKSLLGQNNVWADTGDVDVEYQKIWVRPSA